MDQISGVLDQTRWIRPAGSDPLDQAGHAASGASNKTLKDYQQSIMKFKTQLT